MTSDLYGKLTFDQTVPRSLAHRQAVGEVFVTDSAPGPDGDFLVAVQVPRAHSLWFDRLVPFHDPFCTAEAARQGSFVVLHRYFGVPVGLPFSLLRWQFRVHDLAAYRDDERSPLQGVLRYQVDNKSRGGELGDLTLSGELTVGSSTAMTFNGDVVFFGKADYAALREFQQASKPPPDPAASAVTPLDPALVGRRDRRNVVIGDGERFPYVIDATHPSYFDHAYDHVPGPFIVEGFRQAAVVAAVRAGQLASPVAAVLGCSTTFGSFGEFGALLECSAEVTGAAGGRVTVALELHQYGKRLATAGIELGPYPA